MEDRKRSKTHRREASGKPVVSLNIHVTRQQAGGIALARLIFSTTKIKSRGLKNRVLLTNVGTWRDYAVQGEAGI
jgi:hypothetical protein